MRMLRKICRVVGLICFLATHLVADDTNLKMIRSFLREELSGDIMILNLIHARNRIILQNPIVLQEPYFEAIPKQFGDPDYKEMIKSRARACREPGWLEQDIGYVVFDSDSHVIFVPSNNFYQNDIVKWRNTRGYAAYMEKSDVFFWVEKEAEKDESTLRLDKHQALMWDFPLLKGKYLQMDIYWESAGTRDYAMAFFRTMARPRVEEVAWRLYSREGILYGW